MIQHIIYVKDKPCLEDPTLQCGECKEKEVCEVRIEPKQKSIFSELSQNYATKKAE